VVDELQKRLATATAHKPELLGLTQALHTALMELRSIERKQVALVQAEGEASYRSLVIATAQIIWTTQPNGDMVDSPMWREFTGQSAEQARGWGWLDALHPDDRDRVTRVWAQAIVARSQYETEYRIRKADGSYRIFAVRGVPVIGPDGRVREWVGACTDITVRRRVEETQRFLVEASELLSTALDYESTFPKIARFAVPQLADWCTFDLLENDGSIQRIAIAHADPLKEALAWELHQRYPPLPDDPHGAPAVLRTGKAELMPDVAEAALHGMARDADHLAGLCELGIQSYLCVPLIARGRTLGAMSWGLADASRRYDEFDLHVAEDLAHRAALSMENALLYREAQAAIKVRDQFLSIASHELKTPLTPLLLQAEAIQRRAGRTSTLGERDRQALHTIAEQAQRLSRLIETLLNVSRIQLGRLTIEPQRIDLVALTEQVAAELQPVLDEHTLRLSYTHPSVYVDGDPLRLEQVLQNLLQNAIKYSPSGGTISLEVTQRDDSAWLIVADQGIGIPESALPHLFQRFYRASNVDAQNISGFGIGLYIVHEIVSLHGGSVKVLSTQGAGSTFTVQLPLATA
jgi:PAS domain S-box-containing protein